MSTSAAAFREEAEQRQKEMEGESSRDLEQHILSWVISQCFPHSSDSPSKTLSGFLQESCLFVAPRALSSHLEALDGHMKTLETFALFPHLPHLHPTEDLGRTVTGSGRRFRSSTSMGGACRSWKCSIRFHPHFSRAR